MSDVAGTHSDGVLIFGSQIVTIASLVAVADDISIDTPTNVLTRKNQVGVPDAEVLIEDVLTGSLTLQVPSATAAPPAIGAVFTLKAIGGANLSVKVSKHGQKFSNTSETKFQIEFRKQLNAVVTP